MFKLTFPLLLLILQSCSGYLSKPDNPDANYLSDTSDCIRTAEHKEHFKVPTAGTMTDVEIPMGVDAGAFELCMKYTGHPAPNVNAEEYLAISRSCLQDTKATPSPNEAYAKCVQLRTITVEPIRTR